MQNKINLNTINQILTRLIFVSVGILIIGLLYKIMHWPYASIFILSGFGGILFFYSAKFFLKKNKIALDFLKWIVVILFCFRATFIIMHWPYVLVFNILFFASLILLFFFWVLKPNNQSNSDSKQTVSSFLKQNGFYIVVALCILIGAFFKIMHMPGAGPFLIVGLAGAFIWAVNDMFGKKSKP